MKNTTLTLACYGLAQIIAAEVDDRDEADVVWALNDVELVLADHVRLGTKDGAAEMDPSVIDMLMRIAGTTRFSGTPADGRYQHLALAACNTIDAFEKQSEELLEQAYDYFMTALDCHENEFGQF